MYFPYFATYMIIGIVISVVAFIWALERDQFKDQERARFLPLEDEPERPVPSRVARMGKIEAYTLISLALAGIGITAAVLIFSFLTQPKGM